VTAKANGYTAPLEYTGHGIGREMHEDPYIPDYGEEGTGPILREGMTLAIEPMVMMGSQQAQDPEGWLDGCQQRRQAKRPLREYPSRHQRRL
jgi:methionyl aminopeptidase